MEDLSPESVQSSLVLADGKNGREKRIGQHHRDEEAHLYQANGSGIMPNRCLAHLVPEHDLIDAHIKKYKDAGHSEGPRLAENTADEARVNAEGNPSEGTQ